MPTIELIIDLADGQYGIQLLDWPADQFNAPNYIERGYCFLALQPGPDRPPYRYIEVGRRGREPELTIPGDAPLLPVQTQETAA